MRQERERRCSRLITVKSMNMQISFTSHAPDRARATFTLPFPFYRLYLSLSVLLAQQQQASMRWDPPVSSPFTAFNFDSLSRYSPRIPVNGTSASTTTGQKSKTPILNSQSHPTSHHPFKCRSASRWQVRSEWPWHHNKRSPNCLPGIHQQGRSQETNRHLPTWIRRQLIWCRGQASKLIKRITPCFPARKQGSDLLQLEKKRFNSNEHSKRKHHFASQALHHRDRGQKK